MSDDNERKIPGSPSSALLEERELPDGTHVLDLHGRDCPRTKEVYEALRGGREPPPPNHENPCKPAMVSSDAYRTGWERLFGGRGTVGRA